jgi:hypothetical protein
VHASAGAAAVKVTITVHATPETGFDQSKLENGALEPLWERKLIE